MVNKCAKFDDAIRVFPTIKQVNACNEEMCQKMKDQNIRLYTINAVDRSLEEKKIVE